MSQGLSTDEIMRLALDMAGMDEVPADSAIYVPGTNIRRLLVGIDAGVPELLLGRQLGVDAVLAHHPQGSALRFHEVLHWQTDLLVRYGVPRERAIRATAKLIEGTEVRRHAANYDHAESAARLLGMPYLNIHAPCDELGRRILVETIERHTSEESTLGDVVEALMTLPEFQQAPTRPAIRMGDPKSRRGRLAVFHGVGTNGGYEAAKALFEHGTDTVLYIHIDYGHLERLRAEGRGQLVISGHIASDRVGIEPLLRALEARGVELVRMSGLT